MGVFKGKAVVLVPTIGTYVELHYIDDLVQTKISTFNESRTLYRSLW